MRIVFHGANSQQYMAEFMKWSGGDINVAAVPDEVTSEKDADLYQAADIVVATQYRALPPASPELKLLQVPAAGHDGIRLDLVPAGASVCNCYGHETAISEYVFGALLSRTIPFAEADTGLRRGDWRYTAGRADGLRSELAGKTLGIVGFGNIGKDIARKAKVFGMKVIAANRSPVAVSDICDVYEPLSQMVHLPAASDFVVVALPLTDETRGLIDERFFAAMHGDAVLINVGRGPTVDEDALYDSLAERRIAWGFVDTWYRYPSTDDSSPTGGTRPFQDLPNVTMTPHMSAWTHGLITRRAQSIAKNVQAILDGDMLNNVVRLPLAGKR